MSNGRVYCTPFDFDVFILDDLSHLTYFDLYLCM